LISTDTRRGHLPVGERYRRLHLTDERLLLPERKSERVLKGAESVPLEVITPTMFTPVRRPRRRRGRWVQASSRLVVKPRVKNLNANF
jgi:hypothetical protein